MRAAPWSSLLLVAAGLAWGGAASAQRCCYVHTGPQFLEGFTFQAGDAASADAWAERFGFGFLEPPPTWVAAARTLALPYGHLEWSTETQDQSEGLDASIGRPLPGHYITCVYEPAPPPTPMAHGVAPPPNGALRPLCAIAVASHDPRVVEAFTFRHTAVLRYGGWFPAPELGAYAYDVFVEESHYRFIVPVDSTGIAAQWLPDGPPRWIGVAFQTGDAAATERAFAVRGIPTTRARERDDVAVRVMPEATGGPLLEFVQSPTRP